MSVYTEFDPMLEHGKYTFKCMSKHIAKVSIPNVAYRNQHI